MLKNILKITARAKIFTIAKRYFRAKFKVLQSIGKYGHVERAVGAIVDTPYESPIGLMNVILKNTAGHSEVAFDTESWHRPGHFAPKFAWFA